MAKRDDSVRKTTVLRNLQTKDAEISEILQEVCHTEVYTYDTSVTKWDKLGVAGSCFVVKRTTVPYYRLVVLNKQGLNDFSLNVANIVKIKSQPPYLMIKYKEESSPNPPIYGLWLLDKDEREKLLETIDSTMLKSVQPIDGKPNGKKSDILRNTLKIGNSVAKSTTNTPISSAIFETDGEIAARNNVGSHVPSPLSASALESVSLRLSPEMRSPKKSTDDRVSVFRSETKNKYLTNVKLTYSSQQSFDKSGLLSPSDITGVRRRFV